VGKHPRQQSGSAIHRLVRLGQQSLAVILSALLLLQPAIANAQTVSASTTAPIANQPGVGAAPNGVPLIDIVTPNAAGLSHNKFSDFNVGAPGLILNNYKGEVGTSNLGGVTPGNPNLNNSNPASVILNEVTSGNRSALNGPTEVFGGRADVVIANPNGITCSGCGFINTPHATLTTGVPDIGADGSLTGFTVNGGDVTFEGTGGNFASGPGAVDLFDVVSRSIHVNAPVYGKTLRLTGGASKYDYATGEAAALTATSGTPEYAIDGSALGAMQADRIKIVVTEKGAGVNMAGDMAANAGELSLSADGKISIGNVSGSQGVSISSKSKVTAAKVTSHQKVTVQADQGITLQSVAADDDIVLSSGSGLLSVVADVNSATNLQMSSAAGIAAGSVTAGSGAATLSTSSGDIQIAGAANSHGALTITATSGAISAASLLSYDNIGLTAGLGAIAASGNADIAISGNVFAEGNLTASGGSISTGMVVSGLDIAATQADPNGNVVLGAIGDLSLTATNGNIATGNLLSAGLLNAAATGNMAAGSIQSNRDLTVNATSLTASNITSYGALTVNAATDVSGQILASGDITVTGQGVQAATFASGVDFAATSAAGGTIVLSPTGVLTLDAGAGTIVAGTLLSAGDLNAQAAVLQADSITGHGTIGIDAGVRVSNQLLSAGNITINGNSNGVSAGVLASGVDFAATNAGGGNIALAPSGDLTINDSAGAIQAGTMLSAGNIDATGRTITADTVTGHGNITLSGSTDVSGQILGAGNVSVTGPSITAAAIVSGVDIAATNAAGGSIVLGPATTGTADLSLAATAGLDVGTLLSAGALNAAGATIAADSVTAHGDLALDGATTVSGQVLGSGNVLITGQNVSARTLVAGIDFDATNAASGNIVLSPGGDLTVSVSGAAAASTIQAAGTIDASAATISADAITGHKDITLSGASGGVDVNGQILGANDVSISGSSITAGAVVSGVDFTATAAAGGNIVLGSSGDIRLAATADITAQTLLSAGSIDASAATVAADAVTAHSDITLAAGDSLSVTGQILGANDVSLSGQTVEVNQAITGVDFAATAQSQNGAIVVGSSGDLDINAVSGLAATLIAAGSLDVDASAFTGGDITGHGAVSIGSSTQPGAVAITGQLLGAGDVSIIGSSISGNVVVAGVDFAATEQSAAGAVVLGQAGDLTLNTTSGGADITVNSLLAAGSITATAANNISANAVAHGDLTMNAGNAIMLSGQSLGAQNVSLSARSVTIDSLVSGVDFAATKASSNGSLMLQRTGTMTLAASSGSINANVLLSGGNLAATGAQNIGYASLQSLGNATLTASGAIDYTHTTRVGGDLTINTGVVDLSGTRGSQISGGGTLTLNASSANLSGSNLVFGGLALNLSGNADLSNAQVSTVTNAGGSGDIAVSAAGLTTTASTALLAAHDLTLTLPSLTNAGQLAAGNDLTVHIAGDLTNTPSGLVFANNDANLFVGGTLTNNQGAIVANDNLTIQGAAAGQRNGAVTNVSGLIQAGGDMSILTGNLTNRRSTTPTWVTGQLVSSGAVVGSFVLNPAVAGQPFAYLESADQNMFQLYAGVDPALFSEYQPLLWSVATLAGGTSYHAWTWNSGNGPTEVRPIFDWIKARVPKDANGNPILDPNNPSRYFIVDEVIGWLRCQHHL
jgi:filamentous hemagglutinin